MGICSLLAYHRCNQYHVERPNPAFHIDWCFLCSMIKAEEVGTTRLARAGLPNNTVCLQIWVVKSRLCSFIMLCSFCWVGFFERFVEIPGLIRNADLKVYTDEGFFCNMLRENVTDLTDLKNHTIYKHRHHDC